MENTQTTVANTDNSSAAENFSQEDIISALEEPEVATPETKKAEPEEDNSANNQASSKDNIQSDVPSSKEEKNANEYPDKFKNEDGTVNYDNLLKSYKQLEPLINEKAQWEKERAELLSLKEQYQKQQEEQEELAKQQGFNSALDMQQQYELVNLEANEYAKYLNYTEDPEKTRGLLLQYISNPSDTLLSDIEFEFPAEVIKRVAIAKERQAQQFRQMASEKAETLKMSNIESIISDAVNTHNDLFDYEPFKVLFINALQKYGDNFTTEDAQALMNTVVQLKELFKEEFLKQSETKLQNDKATDKLSALSTLNSAPATSQQPDVSKMNDRQLVKYLKDLV